jgi:hypothetical protein
MCIGPGAGRVLRHAATDHANDRDAVPGSILQSNTRGDPGVSDLPRRQAEAIPARERMESPDRRQLLDRIRPVAGIVQVTGRYRAFARLYASFLILIYLAPDRRVKLDTKQVYSERPNECKSR